MAKIGSVYAGTKYVTLHLVLSNGDREDLEIEISEFIGIQNKLIAAQQKMHPTLGESAASDSESKPAPKRVI